ncbi:hypothetical protein FGO68_gene5193 [Halteria grandinella]|uniref:Uncharacterized protein n=1 Tax=Halteria grandinella TaxID=5974 RepID=A0A8J8T9V8_HALGN|nr:hypothetical protein FGO68_gene5193 [Halteria grandinella]
MDSGLNGSAQTSAQQTSKNKNTNGLPNQTMIGTQGKFYSLVGSGGVGGAGGSAQRNQNLQRILAAYSTSNNNLSQSNTHLSYQENGQQSGVQLKGSKKKGMNVVTGGDSTESGSNPNRLSHQLHTIFGKGTNGDPQGQENRILGGQEVIIKSSSMQPLIGASLNSLHHSQSDNLVQTEHPDSFQNQSMMHNDGEQVHQMRIHQNSRAAGLTANTISQSSGGGAYSSNGVITMNRRPKMNEHNIKLIEKVIKRQNMTAQQESRTTHHVHQLLQHANSHDQVQCNMDAVIQNEGLGSRLYEKQGSLPQRGQISSKTPQIALKNLSKSPNSQGLKASDLALVDESHPSGPPENFITDRIEKTLQKYTKKDVLAKANNGIQSINSLPQTAAKLTRNGLQYPSGTQAQSLGGGSVNSINHVHKIYNSSYSKTAGIIKGAQQINSLQSPYLNNSTANGNATLYNIKHKVKLGVQNAQGNGNLSNLNLDHLDQFRQVNSYSVDRINTGFKQPQVMVNNFGSAEKSDGGDLSFDSLNANNNSFTLGQHKQMNDNVQDLDGLTPSGMMGENLHISQQQILHSQLIAKFQSRHQVAGVSTLPTNSFKQSNQKGLSSFENTPSQVDQSQHSPNIHLILQQSPIQQPQFSSSNGTSSVSGGHRQGQYENNLAFGGAMQGFQDLFYDDKGQQQDDSFKQQSSQSQWQHQMIEKNPNQQRHVQIKQILQYKALVNSNSEDPSQGSVYTLTTGQSKYQMSPMQFHPSGQYSKSRDGGYRNIPTRDISSISDQSPQSNFARKAAGYENQHPNAGVIGTQPSTAGGFDDHPFKRPKLHHFKKDASRRIKTSSATRNLQPIYPLEAVGGGVYAGNKIFSNNFNSIHIGGGGTTTSSNPPSFINASTTNTDPQIYYNNSSYISTKLQQNYNQQHESNIKINIPITNPQSQLKMRKKAQFQNENSESGNTTIDASHDNELQMPRLSALSSIPDPDLYGRRVSNVSGNLSLLQQESRPQTSINNINEIDIHNQATNLEQLHSNSPQNRPSALKQETEINDKIEASTSIQEQINGFKHSFYVEKESTQLIKLNQASQPKNATIKVEIVEIQPKEKGQQENKTAEAQEIYNSTQIVEKEGAGGVKQIFVLNVNATSHYQSIQESKAMTPCFLHTPNMTNKWNDFKPPPISGGEIENSLLQNNSRFIHHQANPSQESQLSNPMMSYQVSDQDKSALPDGKMDDSEMEELFHKKKSFQYGGIAQEIQVNENFKDLQGQGKKPMTSHQTSKSDKKNIHVLQKGNDCSIKLCPQDIYLQSSATTGTTKGSSQSSIGPKPSTSGSSFRRPLSRNHPMLNLVAKNQSSANSDNGCLQGAQPAIINVLQQRSAAATQGSVQSKQSSHTSNATLKQIGRKSQLPSQGSNILVDSKE